MVACGQGTTAAAGDAPDDGALLSAIAAGDRAASRAFVDRHKAALYRFADALLRDKALAEDVLQETFLAALRGAATYRAEGTARGWLFTIARRAAIRLRPREAPLPDDRDIESLGDSAGWGAPDAEQMMEGWQSRERVNRALAALPAEDREILLLRDAEGLTGPEAAEVLQVSLAAMKSRLHRARLRMLAALREEEAPTMETHDGTP
ncbi:MAG: RNA polymerase sigma factor [Polyangiaceae bacterium]